MRLGLLGMLVLALCAVSTAAAAEAPPSVVALALNGSTFSPGDRLSVTLVNENGTASRGDLYLVLRLPDGSALASDGAGWRSIFDGTSLVPGALAPFRADTAISTSSDLLVSLPLSAAMPAGSYTALALLVATGTDPLNPANALSNLARVSFAFSHATPGGSPFLASEDVRAIVRRAAEIASGPAVIAVTDRMGNVLGLHRKTGAPETVTGNFGLPVDSSELAVALARTGSFFSNDQAPLSSRTVRFISGIHFPPGIRNKANAALYGIENTNRGCDLNTTFNAGKTIIPARSLSGLPCNSLDRRGCGLGIATGKADLFDSQPFAVNGAGIPIFKEGVLVGGVGVTGVDPATAEFAALVASTPDGRFGPILPEPGAIFLDGLQLPFAAQTTAPPGAGNGVFTNVFTVGPVDSPLGVLGVPDGWLVGPAPSAELSASEVERIVTQSIDIANQARAAIRLPLGSRTRMMIAVTNLRGEILGLFRMPDATIFSIDVSVAKARNVVFFSGPTRLPDDLPGVPPGTAVTNRTISFGAQPLYPAGIDGTEPGPFFPLFVNDVATPCRQGSETPGLNQSGIVFFPGSMPLYKNGQLVGGLGISGDGVEQDDLVAAGGASGFLPALEIRADEVVVRDVRLPFLKFPRNPFEP
jgi:uncharacterized protein GlcG (DUF336 family)